MGAFREVAEEIFFSSYHNSISTGDRKFAQNNIRKLHKLASEYGSSEISESIMIGGKLSTAFGYMRSDLSRSEYALAYTYSQNILFSSSMQISAMERCD